MKTPSRANVDARRIAKIPSSTHYSEIRGHKKMHRWLVGVVGAVALAGGGYWVWQTSIAADVGAAAMAKVICSCVFGNLLF